MAAHTTTDEGKRTSEATWTSVSEILSIKADNLHAAVENAFHNHEYASALSLLTKAISLDPNNQQYFVKRAEASLLLGDPSSAVTNLRHALTLLPSGACKDTVLQRLSLALYLHGETLFREGMPYLALEKFQSLCALDPSCLAPRLKCIACLHTLDQPAQCMHEVEAALKQHPANADLYVVRARLSCELGKMPQCYQDVQQALVKSDGRHRGAKALLDSLQKEAVTMRTQALELSLEGRKEEAIRKISSAIERNPILAEYHVFRGSLHRQLGSFTRAQEDFHQAIHQCRLSLDHPTVKLAIRQLALTYNDVAVSLFRKAKYKDAVQLLNQSIDAEKHERVLYTNRGACFYRLQDLPFAIADFEEAMSLAPWDWSVRTQLAVTHCDAGVQAFRGKQAPDALKHFTRAIECNPKVSRFYVCRATLRHLRQETVGAQRDIICALTLDPEGQEAQALLARVLPGQPAKDVLQTREAVKVRTELTAMIAKCASLNQTPSTIVDSSVKRGEGDDAEYGIELNAIDSSELGHSSDIPTLDEYPSAHNEQKPAVPVVQDKHEVATPLPISLATGIMPDKKECLQESKFHKALIYSKKANDKTVCEMFQTRPNLGPSQSKLDPAPQEIRLGSRTVQPLHATDLSRKR